MKTTKKLTTGEVRPEPEQALFAPEDVIATYTDGQAVDDGVLVALNPRDRVTRTVWEWLVEKQPKDAKPPTQWPVDMMGWFGATKIPKTEALALITKYGREEAQKKFEQMIADRKARALAVGVIRTHEKQAARVYNENIGGGIYKLFAIENERGIDMLTATDPGTGTRKVLWLLPNENGGTTLMFPEDY